MSFTPLSEPAVRLITATGSPFVGLTQFSAYGISKTKFSLHFTNIQRDSSLLAFGYMCSEIPTNCDPSPSGWFSQPQTTMIAPTLLGVIGGTAHLLICLEASHVHDNELKPDRLGGGFQSTNPALCSIPNGSWITQVPNSFL